MVIDLTLVIQAPNARRLGVWRVFDGSLQDLCKCKYIPHDASIRLMAIFHCSFFFFMCSDVSFTC